MLSIFAYASLAALFIIPSVILRSLIRSDQKVTASRLYALGFVVFLLFGLWGFLHEITLEQAHRQTNQDGQLFVAEMLYYIFAFVIYIVIGIISALFSRWFR